MQISPKNIVDFVFKLLSTISALLPAFFVFTITNYEKLVSKAVNEWIESYKIEFFFIYIIFSLMLVIILNKFFLLVSSGLDDDSINQIISVEPVNDNFLPTYLGYFFVSVSISSPWVFSYFIMLVIAFNLFSKVYFFNPSLLISGFKFYHLTSTKGVKTLLISKQDIRSSKDLDKVNYKRINEFTFIRINYGE